MVSISLRSLYGFCCHTSPVSGKGLAGIPCPGFVEPLLPLDRCGFETKSEELKSCIAERFSLLFKGTTHLLENGTNLRTIQKHSGHNSIKQKKFIHMSGVNILKR